MKAIPQLLIVLFFVKMMISSYQIHQTKQTPLTLREFQNLIIGLTAFNLVLLWGGFYSNIFE